ncbi:MAG: hypothetical protein JXA68_03060, partial [Ignavibacteriales bacterium]|nr:hypothetical protein [Ignavibacteriales bacterium]
MKKTIFIYSLWIFIPTFIFSSVTLSASKSPLAPCYYKTVNDGVWSDKTIWEYSNDGINWFPAPSYPTSSSLGVTIYNTVNLDVDVTMDKMIIWSNGSLYVDIGITLTVGDGSNAIDLNVSGNLINNNSIVVNSGALLSIGSSGVLDCGTHLISGSGNFTLNDNATLKIGHSDGINGNITVTGATSFGVSKYVYTGTTQLTGTYLPYSIHTLERACEGKTPHDLILSNEYVSISNELILTHGRVFVPTNKYLVLETKAIISGTNIDEYRMIVMDDSTSFVRKYFASESKVSFNFPVGTYTGISMQYDYSPANLGLETGLAKTNYLDVYCEDTTKYYSGWTNYLERNWKIVRQGDITYEGTLYYLEDDIVGIDTHIVFGRHTGSGNWDYSGGSIDTINNTLTINSSATGNYYFSGIEPTGLYIYRTKESGNWSDYTKVWESSDDNGNTWNPAIKYPDYLDGEITINDSILVDIAVTTDETDNFSYLIITPGVTLTVNDGLDDDLQNWRTVVDSGTIVNNGTIVHYPDLGGYIYARDGGEIPTMTWESGFHFQPWLHITGIVTTTPIVNPQNNLITAVWDCDGQVSKVALPTNLNPNRTLNIASTGISTLELPVMTFLGSISQDNETNVELSGNITLSSGKTYSNYGVLDCKNFSIIGDGNFLLNDYATLKTSHISGIDGSITCGGAKTFGNAKYYYNHSGDQVTGSYLPTTNIVELMKSTGGVLTLSNTTTKIDSFLVLQGSRLYLPSGKN